MTVNGNQSEVPVNYEPNSHDGPKENVKYAWNKFTVNGLAGRYPN